MAWPKYKLKEKKLWMYPWLPQIASWPFLPPPTSATPSQCNHKPVLFFKDFWCRPFFLCRSFLKSLLNLLQYCFFFFLCFVFFGEEACGILTPQSGTEPASPALEGEVLTTGPPGRSLFLKDVIISSFTDLLLIHNICKFKAYIMIWYKYILQNHYHNKVS